jgi:cytochrome P450
VDLQDLFFKFTIDSATEFLFGQSTDTLRDSLRGETTSASNFAYAFNKAQHAVAIRSRTGLFGFLRVFLQEKGADDAIRICHEFVDEFVDEAIQYRQKFEAGQIDEKDNSYVFLHELAKETADKRRLRDELLNVLLAGRDTTASLLSNMWFMIAKNPEIFAKLRQEVEDTLHGDLPTYEQLRNMKYLKYCMNECEYLSPYHYSQTNCLLSKLSECTLSFLATPV